MSMGMVAGERPSDDDDDVAPLRGDGGGGAVVPNHQFKRCDATVKQTEQNGSNGSPKAPHARTAAQPLECHSMLSMNEHCEPALLRSGGSVVENHKVKREDIDRKDHRKSHKRPKMPHAPSTAQPLECHSISMSEH
jgi:hypothetical protein